MSVGGAAGVAKLVASVLPAQAVSLGEEDFRISRSGGGAVRVDAAATSELLPLPCALCPVPRVTPTAAHRLTRGTSLTSTGACRRGLELWAALRRFRTAEHNAAAQG